MKDISEYKPVNEIEKYIIQWVVSLIFFTFLKNCQIYKNLFLKGNLIG